MLIPCTLFADSLRSFGALSCAPDCAFLALILLNVIGLYAAVVEFLTISGSGWCSVCWFLVLILLIPAAFSYGLADAIDAD